MRFYFCAVLLAALSITLFAQSSPKIPKEVIDEIIAATKDDCPEYKGQAGENALAKTLTAFWVDLDGDKIPELFVKMSNPCMCEESGNCPWWVYQKADDDYVLILDGATGQSVHPQLDAPSDGYKDIVSEYRIGATETALTIYKWDGEKYKQSTCLTRISTGLKQGQPVYKTTPRVCN